MAEFFDYLNCDPDILNERKQIYCSFEIDDEQKKIRREYRKSRRLADETKNDRR